MLPGDREASTNKHMAASSAGRSQSWDELTYVVTLALQPAGCRPVLGSHWWQACTTSMHWSLEELLANLVLPDSGTTVQLSPPLDSPHAPQRWVCPAQHAST